MKIAIINGSPRKNGSVSKILNYLKKYFEENHSGIDIQYINLIDYNIKYCVGCQNCYKTGKCIITDDNVEEIHDTIKLSDGIIFSSPIYGTNVSGLFKSFYDRVHMTMEQLLYKKPCMVIAVYENIAGNTIKIMKDIVKNSGGYNACSLLIKNAFNKDPLNDKNKVKIKKSGKIFVERIHGNKIPIFSKLYTKVVINIFLKPFVFKNRESNKGLIDSWLEKKIIKL
jgi:multimeric flavodoxin WrbA